MMFRSITFFLAIAVCFSLLHFDLIRHSKHIVQKPAPLSGAMRSLDDWTAQRAYPFAVISEDGYSRAFDYIREQVSVKSTGRWKQMGPHNVGGRTLAVAINPLQPSTIYAGSASGGLWRSYSGGVGVAAWQNMVTGFPVLSVSSIAISPLDTNTMYIGTGEVYGYQNSIGGLSIRTTRGSYGVGILKTTNGGTTWSKSLDWSYQQQRGVFTVKFHPADPSILFAGTTEGVFKTTNAGATWTQILNALMVTDLVINTENPSQILAACGNLNSAGKGIYRSVDGGTNWLRITSNLPSTFAGKIQLEIFSVSPNVVYASIGMGSATGAGTSLCKSTDFGLTWNVICQNDYSTYQGWYSHFVIPHSVNPNRLLFGGIDMWKSTDGGATMTKKTNWAAWYFGVVPIGGPEGPTNYSHADHHAYALHPTNPDIVYLATDGGIFKTTDFGETYTGCNGGYQTSQFYKRFGVSRSDSTRAIGGMQDNATAVWEGSLAWRRVLGGDGCCAQISPSSADTMYGSSQYLAISRSSNKGLNWASVAPSSTNEAFNGPFLIAPSAPKIIYAGGDKMYRSTNAGVNWTALNNNVILNGDPILSIGIAYTDPNIVYVSTAPYLARAEIYKTTNGGTTWSNITGALPDRYPVDVAVDPGNPNIVYVALSGFGSSHLYKSTNGGETWLNLGAKLPDVPTSAVFVDPMNTQHIFVGNDLGIFGSFDGGMNWFSAIQGLDDCAMVMDLAYSAKNRTLIAATHGKGVYSMPLDEIAPSAIDGTRDIETIGFTLEQNYPNPFNGNTVIRYYLRESRFVRISLLDISGGEIVVLKNSFEKAGRNEIHIDASSCRLATSGIYFYRLESGTLSLTKKMLYVK